MLDAVLGWIVVLTGTIEFMMNAGWVWWFGVLLIVAGLVTLTLYGSWTRGYRE